MDLNGYFKKPILKILKAGASNNNVVSFAIKVGLATGAVVYLRDQGVWKNSNETAKTYENIKTALHPYIEQAKSYSPFEIPKIPTPTTNSGSISHYWNKAVLTSFQFLSELPDKCTDWTQRGVRSLLENPGIKDLFNGDSSSAEQSNVIKNK